MSSAGRGDSRVFFISHVTLAWLCTFRGNAALFSSFSLKYFSLSRTRAHPLRSRLLPFASVSLFVAREPDKTLVGIVSAVSLFFKNRCGSTAHETTRVSSSSSVVAAATDAKLHARRIRVVVSSSRVLFGPARAQRGFAEMPDHEERSIDRLSDRSSRTGSRFLGLSFSFTRLSRSVPSRPSPRWPSIDR